MPPLPAFSSSTCFSVKKSLLTNLAARSDMAAVQVEWARPSTDAIQQESLWCEDTENIEDALQLGQLRREEDYTLNLIVSVERDGDDAEGCEARMWDIVAAIEEELRQNNTPAGSDQGVRWALLSGWRHIPGVSEGKRVSEIVLRIRVRARI